MKKKVYVKIYFAVITVLLFFIVVIGFNILNKFVLDNEIRNVVKNSINNKEFSVKSKTWFSYSKVEKAVKNYMKDYSDNVKKMKSIINSNDIKDILSSKNYVLDGPLFSNSISTLNSKIKSFTDSYNNLQDMVKEESIMKYINKYDVSSKYVELYKDYMFKDNNKDLKSNIQEINNFYQSGIKILNTDLEVLNLLKDNNTSWTVKDDKIYFYSNTIMNRYNELVLEVK